MDREVASLPISPTARRLLYENNIRTREEALGLDVAGLSSILKSGDSEAEKVMKIIAGSVDTKFSIVSAENLLESDSRFLPTRSPSIDSLLGGGIQLGALTEICGTPGSGKTQMSLQLCVSAFFYENVQNPLAADGEALFIDTEGSFTVQRLKQIATHVIRNIISEIDADTEQEMLERILNNIHIFRVHDYLEQISVIHLLDSFCEEHKKLKFVVVDSICFHFRHGFDDMSLRARLLAVMAQEMIEAAEKYSLATVTTNHMTTDIRKGALTPALGGYWAHAPTTRVLFSISEAGNRIGETIKSPFLPQQRVFFKISTEVIVFPHQYEM